ncbi:type 4 pilus major pilin [Photobacterium damselae]|uniref:type 4 pilus major pilin n=1 Tax=Photobacterium damselae TaxID=38293 RepID=UPI001F290662|nr:type 4 pilus major pilin [Photobacterium damselae]UKA04695.1 type II secretion system GspH family protein [Photobacterium damselae subsp. damselae]
MKKLRGFKNKKGGFTLIEFMLVMVLGLIAAAVLLPRYESYSATSEGRTAAGKCGEFKTYIISNYQDQASYDQLKAQYVNLAPKTFKLNAHKDGIINVWRHPVTATEIDHSGHAGFQIETQGVPRGLACTEFVKRSQSNGWNQILVGSKTIVAETGTSAIIAACAPDVNNSRATISIKMQYWNEVTA